MLSARTSHRCGSSGGQYPGSSCLYRSIVSDRSSLGDCQHMARHHNSCRIQRRDMNLGCGKQRFNNRGGWSIHISGRAQSITLSMCILKGSCVEIYIGEYFVHSMCTNNGIAKNYTALHMSQSVKSGGPLPPTHCLTSNVKCERDLTSRVYRPEPIMVFVAVCTSGLLL